jgi:hypothetical protein
MMTFEDIVDMDWLDSHSVKGEPMDLFPNDYVDFNHYLSADSLSPKLDPASSPPPLLLASSPPSSSAHLFHPGASCSTAAALAAATTTPPPPLTFPTTEQIKQLIELAKHQLALRAAQSNNNNSNSNSNNTNIATSSSSDVANTNTNNLSDQTATIAKEATGAPSSSNSLSATSSLPSSSSQQQQQQHISSTSQLAAHLGSTSLFANENLPDTVSPESLMKIAVDSPTTATLPATKNTSSSRSSSPAAVATIKIKEEDTTMGHLSTPFDDTMDDLKNHGTARRGSLGEEVGSLEAYAASGGIDIKKLTPRERRQLRNKISARNFRVRRKGKQRGSSISFSLSSHSSLSLSSSL